MTDYDMRCGEKSVREYVRFSMTGTTIKQSLPLIICASCLTAMPILGIIGYIMTGSPLMLVLMICALLLGAGIVVFLLITIKTTAKHLMEVYGDQGGLVCSISEHEIIIVRDGRPMRVVEWSDITEASEGKYGFFLRAGDKGLIILDKANVLSGSVTETSELIALKTGAAK